MKICFGVFDWGLGHATRDLPLIKELLKQKHEVHIISTGRALKLLQSHFNSKCTYHDVPSIFVPYPKNSLFALNFVKSAPKMLKTLSRARKLTEEIVSREKYDKVISDCRYDVYDKEDNSYLINHQLRFAAPPLAENIIEKWLEQRMKKYKYILVPDFEEINITGRLSHNLRYIKKSKIKYLGILSQLEKQNKKQDIDFFISISGPEPQRTILENKILPILNEMEGNIVVALGKPEDNSHKSTDKIKFYSFLDAKNQGNIMNRAKFIITRSGYTTVMELSELEKKNVLMIPTPGQTEQVYLGEYYKKNNYFYSVPQSRLNLKEDIKKCSGFNGFSPQWKTEESVKRFMQIVFSG